MYTDRNSPPTTRRRHGFTVVELLVVVVIILILVGLFVVGGMKMNESNRTRLTRSIFASLLAVATEYNASTGATVAADPATDDAVPGTTIKRFIDATYPLPVPQKMLTAINKASFNPSSSDPELRNLVFDAWDTPIRYAPSNDWNNDTTSLPQYPRLFFASAGPDRRWGNVQADSTEAQDNVYSFNFE